MALAGPLTASALRSSLEQGTFVGAWTLDPPRSEIRLRSKSVWGLVPVKGVFRHVAGDAMVSTAGDVTGTVTVVAGSVDTNNAKRDEHLRSSDFFDVADHPIITVTVDGVTPGDEGVRVTGHLSVRGQTRAMDLDAEVSGAGDEVWLDGEIQIDHTDFGMTWNRLGMVSRHTMITVHLLFTRS